MAFLDGTTIRAHAKAAGARKKRIRQRSATRATLGRSRGGFATTNPHRRNRPDQGSIVQLNDTIPLCPKQPCCIAT
jgi:hypothetical protein